jgi:citrate/tricarballylate utilization protein
MVVAVLIVGLLRFWRDMGERQSTLWHPQVLRTALAEALSLRYLDGGGDGCSYPAAVPSQARRWGHHLTFYGFALCFAATTVAAIYHHLLGWPAPYPVLSVPVMLGCAGGAGLVAGPLALLWLKVVRTPASHDGAQTGMDISFLVLLLLTAISGFALLALRETRAMGVVLALHLGIVLGLFFTMPYGKFVHGPYRFLALVKNAAERRRFRTGQVDERF